MSEKTKNVFEQLMEVLATVAEELHMANDALYVVATETIDLAEKIDTLSTKLDKAFSDGIKVIVTTDTTKASSESQSTTPAALKTAQFTFAAKKKGEV